MPSITRPGRSVSVRNSQEVSQDNSIQSKINEIRKELFLSGELGNRKLQISENGVINILQTRLRNHHNIHNEFEKTSLINMDEYIYRNFDDPNKGFQQLKNNIQNPIDENVRIFNTVGPTIQLIVNKSFDNNKLRFHLKQNVYKIDREEILNIESMISLETYNAVLDHIFKSIESDFEDILSQANESTLEFNVVFPQETVTNETFVSKFIQESLPCQLYLRSIHLYDRYGSKISYDPILEMLKKNDDNAVYGRMIENVSIPHCILYQDGSIPDNLGEHFQLNNNIIYLPIFDLTYENFIRVYDQIINLPNKHSILSLQNSEIDYTFTIKPSSDLEKVKIRSITFDRDLDGCLLVKISFKEILAGLRKSIVKMDHIYIDKTDYMLCLILLGIIRVGDDIFLYIGKYDNKSFIHSFKPNNKLGRDTIHNRLDPRNVSNNLKHSQHLLYVATDMKIDINPLLKFLKEDHPTINRLYTEVNNTDILFDKITHLSNMERINRSFKFNSMESLSYTLTKIKLLKKSSSMDLRIIFVDFVLFNEVSDIRVVYNLNLFNIVRLFMKRFDDEKINELKTFCNKIQYKERTLIRSLLSFIAIMDNFALIEEIDDKDVVKISDIITDNIEQLSSMKLLNIYNKKEIPQNVSRTKEQI